MAKVKTAYFCQNCGAQASKWVGRCSACGAWNTYVEEVLEKTSSRDSYAWRSGHESQTQKGTRPVALTEVRGDREVRLVTTDAELNRVLGGGLVPGSLVLIGGEPGIGKSTLMLQLAMQEPDWRVLYVSGEESLQQIRLRAERLGKPHDNCYLFTETATPKIFRTAQDFSPDLLIIDSIQTMHSDKLDASPGSLSQVRHCAGELQRYAKETDIPVIVIGHINKEGSIAGPKVLEHIVDTVLQFEGDRHYAYRILRTVKNRFGSAAELGIYAMEHTGLRQVENPSEVLLSQREEALSGIAVAATVEGIRPMLIETQALVSSAVYGTPQRTSTGFDLRRMNMLLAVLEKRCGMQYGTSDVFLNMAGGLKVEDPAIDLAVITALMSSLRDRPVPDGYCFAGEVGLSGEVRAVSRIEQRVAEAGKLGFKRIVISTYNRLPKKVTDGPIKIVPVKRVDEVLEMIFE